MRVIDPAHRYAVGGEQQLQFIKKGPAPADSPTPGAFVTLVDGATTEDVLLVLIDRTRMLNISVACRENSLAITRMQEALFWLQERTRNRVAQAVEGTAKPHQS